MPAPEENTAAAPAQEEMYIPPRKRGLSKKMLIYIVGLFWSTFIIFLLMYFFVYRPRLNDTEDTSLAALNAGNDSTAALDSAVVDTVASVDSSLESIHPPMEMPSHPSLQEEEESDTDAAIQALLLETRQHKKDIDQLWIEVIGLALLKARERDSLFTGKATPAAETKRVEEKTVESTAVTPPPPSIELPPVNKATETGAKFEAPAKDALIATNAKIYGSMKPNAAAAILAQFDDEMAAAILLKIKIRQSAKILEAMGVERATKICKLMANSGRKSDS